MDLNDFRKQIVEMRKKGPIRDYLRRVPGGGTTPPHLERIDIDRLSRINQGIIDSMTPLERLNPFLTAIPGRCLRIARGAGVQPSEVSEFFASWRRLNIWFKLP
jgi:signal recognition particle subunit SRP54